MKALDQYHDLEYQFHMISLTAPKLLPVRLILSIKAFQSTGDSVCSGLLVLQASSNLYYIDRGTCVYR